MPEIDFSYWAILTLPILFWSAYHYYKDRHRPEPLALLCVLLALGYGSAYLGQWLYYGLGTVGLRYDAYELAQRSSLSLFVYTILAIGPIEELAKFIPFICIAVRQSHFDEPLDGVIYGSFIALGFALNENQHYLLQLRGWEAAARGIAAPMVHVLFASIWAYAYAYAENHKMNRSLLTTVGLLVAIFLHAVYDFFAIKISIWTSVIPPLIILSIWLWRMRAIRQDTMI